MGLTIQSKVKLNNGVEMPQFGLGVWQIPAGAPTRRAVKAALLRGTGGLVVEDVPVPEAGPGEIVVSMRACGLCGSDLEKIRGTYTAAPPVIGHEAVGIVSEVGEGVEGIQEGARVFPHHHVPCGRCRACTGGSPTMCAQYRATNLEPGGFAESFRVPRWNVDHGGVLRLPPSVDFERASFIDGIELRNPSYAGRVRGDRARHLNEHVLRVAETGSSDAHHAALVGTCWTDFPGITSEDLRGALRAHATKADGRGWTLREHLDGAAKQQWRSMVRDPIKRARRTMTRSKKK